MRWGESTLFRMRRKIPAWVIWVKYLLQLKEQVPVVTSYGDYFDRDGNRYTYDTDAGGTYETVVDNYFYLEYENLERKRNLSLLQPYEN